MSFVTRNTYYFDVPGPANTKDAARFAVERAKELGVRTIVVASTSGASALEFMNAMKGSGISCQVRDENDGLCTVPHKLS